MKQNNYTELSGYSFLKIYSRNGTPDPPRPQIQIFPDFHGYPLGHFSFSKRFSYGLLWAPGSGGVLKAWEGDEAAG